MSDTHASYRATDRAFHVEGHERIEFSLTYVDGAFSAENGEIANSFRRSERCLMVIDRSVFELYGEAIEDYFRHHEIALTAVPVQIAETDKSLATVEQIVDAFGEFGLIRKEPVLVVGGGLTTDVAGFACASYRRGTNYLRVPTTLIGLVDASVAVKVAVNHRHLKNRLGAYHASETVILDFSFLATLPTAQVRNGMAELVKIAVVANRGVFELLDQHGVELMESGFGHRDGSARLRELGHQVTDQAIRTMLDLEVPNLHELDLDREIAYGHTWSPTLELTPERPMLHGHAVSIDMALSVTLAAERGYISIVARDRVLELMSRLGLAVDSPYLTPALLHEATAAIVQTRDGLLRAAVPRPLGTCHFINDLSPTELETGLALHKRLCRELPRGGDGVEMFIEQPAGSPA
jgi:3-dehydroquinate synthetase